MQDFITSYIDFASEGTESPKIFHRWSIIGTLAAFLSRQYNVRHGHNIIQPNLYIMLIGTAGSRKSTAIKMATNLLRKTSYTTFASEKTTKEKFLLDLAGISDEPAPGKGAKLEDLLESNLFLGGLDGDNDTSNMFIAADEFNDFFGNDILNFLSMLGVLWDYNGTYENKVKNGKSVTIPNPTINILGGSTPSTFATTFPPEIIGQGFFSRSLLIYGERSEKRFAFPEPPDEAKRSELLEQLARIKSTAFGTIEIVGTAKSLLTKIYNQPLGFDDFRFESYGNRRFTQLLKLCLIVSASRFANTVEECDVVYANTILSHAEQLMPKALGEFGRAKNADVTHKVLQIIYNSMESVNFKTLWQALGGKDFDKPQDLGVVIQNLLMAGKIQKANDAGDLLPKRRQISYDDDLNGTVDWELISDEERGMSP
jgi:hypothetical protein